MEMPRSSRPAPGPLLVLALAFSLLTFAATVGTNASELRHTAIVKAVQKARPSVVNIHGHKTLTADGDQVGYGSNGRQVNGMGTGVVIDSRGYIITNFHVVEGVRRIQVTMADKKTYVARLVAHDAKHDLAIVQITPEAPLPEITIGTSSDLMAGEPVVAVGNAFGYEHTVTRGIISALHRDVPVSDDQQYDDLIQTDASINPGNSGGPLLNIDGEMIGINVAVRVGAQGIGFAIPVDKAMELAAELMSVERNERIWHGVSGKTVVAPERQFVVQSVTADSPAEKAGLAVGDKIVSVGELKVERALDFERAMLGHKEGDKLAVAIMRESKPLTIDMQIAGTPLEQLPQSTTQRTWELLGLKLQPVPANDFRRISSRYRGGLRIEAVRENSPAVAQGIRSGDILVGMHVWETVTLDNVTYILNRPDFEQFQPVKFYLLRGSETLYTHLPIAMRRPR